MIRSGLRYVALLIAISSAMALIDANGAPSAMANQDRAPGPQSVITHASVTVEGARIHYTATAGALILHNREGVPTASIFFVAYTEAQSKNAPPRPITFLYNGGPGSSTVWLHMGAFGPVRVIAGDHTHTHPAPYQLVENKYSLLDATDLVFIDAPGTGFSRIITKKEHGAGSPKQFYGVDQDAEAFSQFIVDYLSKFRRWNSPKYLFGESYGTMRSAVVANDLETQYDVDLNGVILLSTVLSEDVTHAVETNPGDVLPYALQLPSFTATACYHHVIGNCQDLETLLHSVEHFAITRYLPALIAGSTLSHQKKLNTARQLHAYTGLPVDYLMRANLRVTQAQFEKQLLSGSDQTVGRLDSRFVGPSMDPLSETKAYDPQGAAIGAAYVAAFHQYLSDDLKYTSALNYRVHNRSTALRHWDWAHEPPGVHYSIGRTTTNVMPDLAHAMKYNPRLKVLVNAGYYDLATPFFAAEYTMHHLQIPKALDRNITFQLYHSGHMVYVHVPSLKRLHDNVARFIQSTDGEESHHQRSP